MAPRFDHRRAIPATRAGDGRTSAADLGIKKLATGYRTEGVWGMLAALPPTVDRTPRGTIFGPREAMVSSSRRYRGLTRKVHRVSAQKRRDSLPKAPAFLTRRWKAPSGGVICRNNAADIADRIERPPGRTTVDKMRGVFTGSSRWTSATPRQNGR